MEAWHCRANGRELAALPTFEAGADFEGGDLSKAIAVQIAMPEDRPSRFVHFPARSAANRPPPTQW